MTEKEYLEDKLSKARNPIIANIFFRLNLIERMGTGVQRINAEYKNSVNKPKYKISDNLIVVTLPLVNATTQTTQTLTHKTTQTLTDKTTQTTPNSDNTTPKTTPNIDNTTPKKTIDTIISLIKHNNKITAAEIADKVGLTRDGVRYHLNNMKNKGMIKHCGTIQNGYWEILKEV